MKKIISLIFALTIVSSCNQKDIVAESDRLVIKLYDTIETENLPKKVFKVDAEKMNDFRNILKDTKITDYCCCPTPVYSISFFKNNKELDILSVDTFEFKDEIRIYDRSYQYSYVVEKQKWKSFIDKLEN